MLVSLPRRPLRGPSEGPVAIRPAPAVGWVWMALLGATFRTLWFSVVAVAASTGCVRRELTIESDPPGALVFLNDQEIGRTPVTRSFTFYGTYDVVLRLEGYDTLRAKKLVLAPWWQWVPIDFAAEFFPLTDRQTARFVLQRSVEPGFDPPETLLERAAELRSQLPATRPATQPVLSAPDTSGR